MEFYCCPRLKAHRRHTLLHWTKWRSSLWTHTHTFLFSCYQKYSLEHQICGFSVIQVIFSPKVQPAILESYSVKHISIFCDQIKLHWNCIQKMCNIARFVFYDVYTEVSLHFCAIPYWDSSQCEQRIRFNPFASSFSSGLGYVS